jgi:hypothetical protein
MVSLSHTLLRYVLFALRTASFCLSLRRLVSFGIAFPPSLVMAIVFLLVHHLSVATTQYTTPMLPYVRREDEE